MSHRNRSCCPPGITERILLGFGRALDKTFESEWYTWYRYFDGTNDPHFKLRYARKMVSLANNHKQASRTLYRVHEIYTKHFQDNEEVKQLLVEIFSKVLAYSINAMDYLKAYPHYPDEEAAQQLCCMILQRAAHEETMDSRCSRYPGPFWTYWNIFDATIQRHPDVAKEAFEGMLRHDTNVKTGKIVRSRREMHEM